MAEGRVDRRLAAILAGDVAGYSRLMGADEEGTLSRLNAHRREFLGPKVAEHRGRIVKRTGDGVLIEFASAVDAARCAIEIQHGEWKDRIPAVVHVDGTARVQTVRREHNERIHNLLMEFEKLTGVPVLVNTSFNIKGEPIVETPQDAMNCFIYTGIDYLALHDTLVAKNILYRILSPFIKVYYESMARSRDETD